MAGRFPSEWIDEVRDKSDIVSVVSEYVTLQKKGAKHWGLCPFHGEKTPSFSVDQEKQMFYCFGCHAGGNVITFVMNIEHMEFPEAVRHLAERAHMPIPELQRGEDTGPKKDRDRLYAALVEAAKFYHKTLYTPDGAQALEYLHNRGIRDNVIRHFGLGATARGWSSLYTHLSDMGFAKQELIDANLALERGGKVFDAFRERVMFPIFDPRGRVIAFGGRVMGDGQPKYLNSSDTPVFNKRKNVYGLNFLKGGRRESLRLVEGYMDAVSLRRHGVEGVVATLGTALTPEQASLMARYAPEIWISYDGDSAGQKATLRALDILEAQNVRARVILYPDGMDPDDFMRAQGAQAFAQLAPMDAYEFRLLRAQDGLDLATQDGRTQYALTACGILKRVKNPVELENYVAIVAQRTGFERDVLYRQIGASPVERSPAVRPRRVAPPKSPPDYVLAQQRLVALKAANLLPEGTVCPEDFDDAVCRALFEGLSAGRTPGELVGEMAEGEDRATALGALEYEALPQDAAVALEMAGQCLASIRRRRLEEQIAALRQALSTAQGAQRRELLERLNGLLAELDRF